MQTLRVKPHHGSGDGRFPPQHSRAHGRSILTTLPPNFRCATWLYPQYEVAFTKVTGSAKVDPGRSVERFA